jgi:MFS superfamily sulfate permease-like transporter
MGKITLPGIIIIVLLFIILAAGLAAHVTVGVEAAPVTMPKELPSDTHPVSLLGVMWDDFTDFIRDGLLSLIPSGCSEGT